jgi:hypothetical protein
MLVTLDRLDRLDFDLDRLESTLRASRTAGIGDVLLLAIRAQSSVSTRVAACSENMYFEMLTEAQDLPALVTHMTDCGDGPTSERGIALCRFWLNDFLT